MLRTCAGFREWNAGIPVPVIPFEMMPETWASERCCTLVLATMFGARSLPLPSSPWHPAQVEVKVRLPGTEFVLKSSSHESCACDNETTTLVVHMMAKIAMSLQTERRESLV